jgi:hypothetical protein
MRIYARLNIMWTHHDIGPTPRKAAKDDSNGPGDLNVNHEGRAKHEPNMGQYDAKKAKHKPDQGPRSEEDRYQNRGTMQLV